MDIRADAIREGRLRFRRPMSLKREAGISAEATRRRRDGSPRALLIIAFVALLGVALALSALSAVVPRPASAPAAAPSDVVEEEEGAAPWVYDDVDLEGLQLRLGSVYTR
jgi:hypothetical protein